MPCTLFDNALLRSLPNIYLQQWLEEGDIRVMHTGETLRMPRDDAHWVYFPINAILTWVNLLKNGVSTAIAMIGREGAAGWQDMLALNNHLMVHCAGKCLRVPVSLVRESLHKLPITNQHYIGFLQALTGQISQTAVCNRHHTLEQQLIRLLLLTMDRSEGRQLRMTHEHMARQLGSRREGVSAAARTLQQRGIMSYSRGRITIHDELALRQRACECYRLMSQVYAGLQQTH